MKTKLTLIFVLISSIIFADGGDGYGTKCYVHDIEITYNLFYYSVDGQLKTINNKGKEEKYDITSNIAIYNINTKKISYLFSDTLQERIYEFYFESHYDSINRQILFNRNDNRQYQMDNIVGNFGILNRLPSEKLFIITYSYISNKYSLWTAHKMGTDLTKVYEFSKDANYYFDVKNKVIRFARQVDKKVEIIEFKY
jgi:hypothetical protein